MDVKDGEHEARVCLSACEPTGSNHNSDFTLGSGERRSEYLVAFIVLDADKTPTDRTGLRALYEGQIHGAFHRFGNRAFDRADIHKVSLVGTEVDRINHC